MRYIHDDVLGIADRLKSIEDGYFILFNTMSGKYEVHSTCNPDSTYCFIVPYDALDVRTVHYCIETLNANKDKLLKKIDDDNAKLQKDRMRDFSNKIEAASYETAQELQLAQEKDDLHVGYRRTHGGKL